MGDLLRFQADPDMSALHATHLEKMLETLESTNRIIMEQTTSTNEQRTFKPSISTALHILQCFWLLALHLRIHHMSVSGNTMQMSTAIASALNAHSADSADVMLSNSVRPPPVTVASDDQIKWLNERMRRRGSCPPSVT